ncbi:MAG: threonylcarbamoyl-AMP synthase [Clostridiales bacterium]|nr:threonylcarbamoyl-AMP synthase [Clostridiales bacterium]
MVTQILQPTEANILRCAATLKLGGLVAFPTETVYALGCVATSADAVKKVFAVKDRPTDRALIVAVAKKSDIASVAAEINDKAQILIDKFMPGALTVLLDRAPCIPDEVTAGTNSVAVRIPDNAIARRLIELTGKPVVVPSANTSDKSAPTLAAHVQDDLDGKIELILDGGESAIGIESTIVDTRTVPPTIVRAGAVTVEQITEAIGEVQFKSARPASHNQKYIPRSEVLFSAYYAGMRDNVASRYDRLTDEGRKAVILCLDDGKAFYGARNTIAVGKTYEDYAHSLFATLRRADDENYDVVIAEGVRPDGIGKTLIARLIKIANGNII